MPIDGLTLVQWPDQTLRGRLTFNDNSLARDAIVSLASAREYQRFGLMRPDFATDAMIQEKAESPGVLFISTAQPVRGREFDLVLKTKLPTGEAFTRFNTKIGADDTITLTRSVLAVDKFSDVGDRETAREAAQTQDPRITGSLEAERIKKHAPKLTALNTEILASPPKKTSFQSQVAPANPSPPAPATLPAPVVASTPRPAEVSAPLLTAATPAQTSMPTSALPNLLMAPPSTPQSGPPESAPLSESISIHINKLDLILWLAGISLVLSIGGPLWSAFSRKNDEIQRLKDSQTTALINRLPSAYESGQAASLPAGQNNADKRGYGPLYESETELALVQAIEQKHVAIASAQTRANYYQTLVNVGQQDGRDGWGQAKPPESSPARAPQTSSPAPESVHATTVGLNALGNPSQLPESPTKAVDPVHQPNVAPPSEPELKTTVSGPSVTTAELGGGPAGNIPVRLIRAPALQVAAPTAEESTQAASQPRPAQRVNPQKSAWSEKLDLAVVYLNMGDLPTAAILAKEVAATGTPEIAQEARELIASIEKLNEN